MIILIIIGSGMIAGVWDNEGCEGSRCAHADDCREGALFEQNNAVDLSDATSATIKFDYRTGGLPDAPDCLKYNLHAKNLFRLQTIKKDETTKVHEQTFVLPVDCNDETRSVYVKHNPKNSVYARIKGTNTPFETSLYCIGLVDEISDIPGACNGKYAVDWLQRGKSRKICESGWYNFEDGEYVPVVIHEKYNSTEEQWELHYYNPDPDDCTEFIECAVKELSDEEDDFFEEEDVVAEPLTSFSVIADVHNSSDTRSESYCLGAYTQVGGG